MSGLKMGFPAHLHEQSLHKMNSDYIPRQDRSHSYIGKLPSGQARNRLQRMKRHGGGVRKGKEDSKTHKVSM